MKRLISMLLAVAMFSTLCACNNDGERTVSNTYCPPEDAGLTFLGISDNGYGVISVIENKGDQAIKNVTIELACFDRNGYWTEYDSLCDFISLDYDTINLLPGENKILNGSYGLSDNHRYVDGAISYIEYMDGSVWESETIEAWEEKCKGGFDIEKWRANIEGMKELADKAISDNKHMSISIKGSKRDSFVHANLNMNIGNIGSRAITSFTILMLCFDSNGFPVNTGHGNLASNSCCYIIEGQSAKSNEHGTASFEFYISQDAGIQSLEGIVSEIEFSDGTIWTNPYAPYWELYYGDVVGK